MHKQDLEGMMWGEANQKIRYVEDFEIRAGQRYVKMLCFCGRPFVANIAKIKRGHTRSCGCVRRLVDYGSHSRTHGMSGTPFFATWNSMVTRATLPHKNPGWFQRFAGTGPKIDPRYVGKPNGFQNFYDDMFPTYFNGASLDRKKNTIGYFKDNMRWVPPRAQQWNKLNSKMVNVDGIDACVASHCSRLNLSTNVVYARLRNGWTVEEAFEKADRSHHHRRFRVRE